MKKVKKIFKITLILFLVVIVSLVAAPFLFKGKIEEYIKTEINKKVNADVDFAEVDLNFIKKFPNASINIRGLQVINKEPFLGDTLFFADDIQAKMSLKQLTKLGKDKVIIDAFKINGIKINLITNKEHVNNFHIAKESEMSKTESTSGEKSDTNLQLSVTEYSILNTDIDYRDEATGTHLLIKDFNHLGTGDLANDVVDLDTETSMLLSLDHSNVNYLTNYNVNLDAVINIDNKNGKYTFKENKLLINRMEMVFDGFFKQNEENNELDIYFKTPSTTFKNFIALIPSVYSGNVDKVDTNGNFEVSGFVKGIMDDTSIPKFVVDIVSENASVQYPELPKRIENINLKMTLANTSGGKNGNHLDINTLSFKIDQDAFTAKSTIKHLTTNPLVDSHLDGVLNLGNLSKAYPIEMENELEGVLTANLNVHFDRESVEKETYQEIWNEGDFSITDFIHFSKDIVNPIHISNVKVNFSNQKILLNEFVATTGKSDMNITGTIENLLGFLFNNKELKGDFKLNSNYFAVNDFMVDQADDSDVSADTKTTATATGDALNIPAVLDVKMSADVKTVEYDNLLLKNVVGDLVIRNETVALSNMSTELFDGSLNFSGNVSTKQEYPTFEMDLAIDQFDISKSFKALDLFQGLTPIAKALDGKLNSNLKLKGNLDDNFAPDLNSLTGEALTEILTAKILPKQAAIFQKIGGELNFIDWKKLDLKDLKTRLAFDDGKVTVNPFKLKYEDIDIEVGGAHGFDQSIDYDATFHVPAKYLGSDVSNLLSKLNDPEIEKMTVPVVANITGTSTEPFLKTDLKQSVTNLTKQLIDYQKQKLFENPGGGLLDKIFGSNKKDGDSTDTKNNAFDEILGDIFGNSNKNDKDEDSTNTHKDKPNVGDVLGGLLGGKKKKEDDE